MIPIVDERFEPPIGFQTSGGPSWRTEIVQLASGAEARNALWSGPIRRWQVSGVPLSLHAARRLLRFFNARSGAAQGFRFRDPFGYSTAGEGQAVSPMDEFIGEGDGETRRFALTLDEGANVARSITRVIAPSLRVAFNGNEVSAFSINEAGELVFDAPPDDGIRITAGFEFDTPVRFETDTLDLSLPTSGAVQLVRLSLIELKEAF